MSIAEKTLAAWNGDAPDWIMAMAAQADLTSQNKLAKQLDRSTAIVSRLLNNNYDVDVTMIEEHVRGRLMREAVDCPGAGQEITKDVCRDWRAKARNFSGHNAKRVQMFRACHGCTRFTGDQS